MNMNAIEKQREELRFEYLANIKKSDERLDELHAQNLAIEACLDDYFDYQVKLKYRLDEMKNERINNGVYEGAHLYEETIEVVQDDYNKAESALTAMQDEIAGERKSIVKQQEDFEHDYMHAISKLEEGSAK